MDKAALKDETAGRVEGYLSTLDSVYNMGLLFANKNQVLWWRLGPTEKHCENKSGSTGCASLDGKSHTAKWYIARDLIPGRPGAAQTCGGYQCQCYFENKAGDRVTL